MNVFLLSKGGRRYHRYSGNDPIKGSLISMLSASSNPLIDFHENHQRGW